MNNQNKYTMRKSILFTWAIVLSLLLTSFKIADKVIMSATKCDITQFYEGIEPEWGTKVVTSLGDLEDVDIILVPTKIEEGDYKTYVTRKGSNIYKLDGTNYYIETMYCYEYAIYNSAIIRVKSNYGYIKGVVFWD